MRRLRFSLNNREVSLEIDEGRLLADVLREDLDLTGTKVACGVGICGACSVLVDDKLMSACLLPAIFVDGVSVKTIEGLARGKGAVSSLEESFECHGGYQCGVCTPGQLIAATALLSELQCPTEADVREWMGGNLCRCTGYRAIVNSVLSAAEERVEPRRGVA